jgi:hypothetical protein
MVLKHSTDIGAYMGADVLLTNIATSALLLNVLLRKTATFETRTMPEIPWICSPIVSWLFISPY